MFQTKVVDNLQKWFIHTQMLVNTLTIKKYKRDEWYDKKRNRKTKECVRNL